MSHSSSPRASSMAPHIALHEVGATFEGKPMSFRQNDMRKADFLNQPRRQGAAR